MVKLKIDNIEVEVEAGKAPHRPPVHHMVLEPGIAQVRGDNMLDRVHCVRMDGGFHVWTLHADIKRSYICPIDHISAAYEYPVTDARVINLKRCDKFIHDIHSFSKYIVVY